MAKFSKKTKQVVSTIFFLLFFGFTSIYFEANGVLSLSDTFSTLAVLSVLFGIAFTPEILFHRLVLKEKKLLSDLFSLDENHKQSIFLKPIFMGGIGFFLFFFLSIIAKYFQNH